jgi:hypothetical protein
MKLSRYVVGKSNVFKSLQITIGTDYYLTDLLNDVIKILAKWLSYCMHTLR